MSATKKYSEYTATDGSKWLILVSLDERFGTWPRSRWRREGDDWIHDGIGSSGGITDPDEAIQHERDYIDFDVIPRRRKVSA